MENCAKEKNYVFFSIIIPAHNEENYISETLKSLEQMDYLKEKFEVILVENGSTDHTNEIIQNFIRHCKISTKTIFLERNGVSLAKNTGASLVKRESQWLIFLDADTCLGKNFLNKLQDTILKNKDLSIIVTSLKPQTNSFKANAWFSFYNFGRWVSQSSMSIQIVRKDVFEKIKFDENLTFNEDLTLIKQAKKYGRFHFLWTSEVITSTRRFDKVGYLKQFLIWVYFNIIPERKRRQIKYPVIR